VVEIKNCFITLSLNKIAMGDNFFEESTAAVGTIFTIVALAVIISILIWG
jgi:hypothetical protein